MFLAILGRALILGGGKREDDHGMNKLFHGSSGGVVAMGTNEIADIVESGTFFMRGSVLDSLFYVLSDQGYKKLGDSRWDGYRTYVRMQLNMMIPPGRTRDFIWSVHHTGHKQGGTRRTKQKMTRKLRSCPWEVGLEG